MKSSNLFRLIPLSKAYIIQGACLVDLRIVTSESHISGEKLYVYIDSLFDGVKSLSVEMMNQRSQEFVILIFLTFAVYENGGTKFVREFDASLGITRYKVRTRGNISHFYEN